MVLSSCLSVNHHYFILTNLRECIRSILEGREGSFVFHSFLFAPLSVSEFIDLYPLVLRWSADLPYILRKHSGTHGVKSCFKPDVGEGELRAMIQDVVTYPGSVALGDSSSINDGFGAARRLVFTGRFSRPIGKTIRHLEFSKQSSWVDVYCLKVIINPETMWVITAFPVKRV